MFNSLLAQLVERETVNLEAVGSIPTRRVKIIFLLLYRFFHIFFLSIIITVLTHFISTLLTASSMIDHLSLYHIGF